MPEPARRAEIRDAIEQTVNRYAWWYDFEDAGSGIGACFTEDSEGDFGHTVTHGRAEMVAELQRLRAVNFAGRFTMHVNTNSWVRDQTADRARVTTYCTVYVKDPGAQSWERIAGGYYDDVFVPQGDEWLIQRRQWMFSRRL